MNCSDINEFLDDFLSGELSPLAIVAFEQHIAKCSECKSKVVEAMVIQEKLRNLAVPQPSAGFDQRVFDNVRKHYKDESSWSFSPKLAVGIASLSAVSLAILLVMSEQTTVAPNFEPQMVSIDLNHSQPVRLVFDVDRNIKQAELSINLPENVELEGYPGHKQFKWKTNLVKGQNLLALPIKSTGYGRGQLHTELRYNNSVKTLDLLLTATETAGNSQFDTTKLLHKF